MHRFHRLAFSCVLATCLLLIIIGAMYPWHGCRVNSNPNETEGLVRCNKVKPLHVLVFLAVSLVLTSLVIDCAVGSVADQGNVSCFKRAASMLDRVVGQQHEESTVSMTASGPHALDLLCKVVGLVGLAIGMAQPTWWYCGAVELSLWNGCDLGDSTGALRGESMCPKVRVVSGLAIASLALALALLISTFFSARWRAASIALSLLASACSIATVGIAMTVDLGQTSLGIGFIFSFVGAGATLLGTAVGMPGNATSAPWEGAALGPGALQDSTSGQDEEVPQKRTEVSAPAAASSLPRIAWKHTDKDELHHTRYGAATDQPPQIQVDP